MNELDEAMHKTIMSCDVRSTEGKRVTALSLIMTSYGYSLRLTGIHVDLISNCLDRTKTWL